MTGPTPENELSIARQVVGRYRRARVVALQDVDDMLHEAWIAAHLSTRSYKPELGGWGTHAFQHARARVSRLMKDNATTVRVPVHARDKGATVQVGPLELDVPVDAETPSFHWRLLDACYAVIDRQDERRTTICYSLLEWRWLNDEPEGYTALSERLGLSREGVRQNELRFSALVRAELKRRLR